MPLWFLSFLTIGFRHSPDGMAKVIEGLIAGIGFIGGGAILKQGNSVHGTATAASLWATGAKAFGRIRLQCRSRPPWRSK
jgi:uncharacterized membrane protein YhiD involved in acid resistance